jgi:photosystem II stability/assembly factor-like uncharacterized protein
LKSSSKGIYFSKILEAVNQNANGATDFQRLPGMEMAALANFVSNSKIVGGGLSKKVESMITLDDGISWSTLKAPEADSFNTPYNCAPTNSCKLHVHLHAGENSFQKISRPFGSSSSAGVLLAVGNVGNSLLEYDSGNLFLSINGGQGWKEVFKGPHLWAVGEHGGLLVVVKDKQFVSNLMYTWDYGTKWASLKFSEVPLSVDSIFPFQGTSKVLLVGHAANSDEANLVLLDFGSIFSRKCTESDFATWKLSQDFCYLGEKYEIIRRRADSICSVGTDFKSEVPGKGICECQEIDFECVDAYFRDEVGQCKFSTIDPFQPKDCKNGTTYQGTNGYQKMEITKCTGGKNLAGKVDRICGSEPTGPQNVKISTFQFDAQVDDFFYFPNSDSIMAKDSSHHVYLSENNGKSWKKVLEDVENLVGIMIDSFHPGRAFVFGSENTIYMTKDSGKSFDKLTPEGYVDKSVVLEALVVHPSNAEWLIWIGAIDCKGSSGTCHTIAQVSWNSGQSWSKFAEYAETCVWAASDDFKIPHENAIFCSIYRGKGDQRSLNTLYLHRFEDATSDYSELFPISGFGMEKEYFIAAMVQVSLCSHLRTLEK